METAQIAQIIASLCTALSCLLSFHLIVQHLRNWTNPKQQRLTILIILMVPLFAVDSLIGLFEIEAAESVVMILDSVKECYEALVLMSFLELMFQCMGVDMKKSHADKHSDEGLPGSMKGRELHHTFPVTIWSKHMHTNWHTLHRLHFWTYQFIVLRPILSILSVVLDVTGRYEKFSMYISIILNVSVTVAVYALMLFYHAFSEEMKKWRPLAQFLCIKGVVFFAFWQGVVLSVLVSMGILHEGHCWSTDEVETAIQNFLVCVEMGLLFSFAHLYAFSAENYKKKD